MKKLAVFVECILLSSCNIFGPVDPIGPTVITGEITDVQLSSLKISGTISSPNYKNKRQEKKSGQIVEYGFVYGTSEDPDAGAVHKVGDTIKTFPFDFSATLSGLTVNSDYKVWAYAKNETGILTYGNESGKQTIDVPSTSYIVGNHLVSATNTSGHITSINHVSLNNNPNAIVIVTANWEGANQYNESPIGLWYSQPNWKVFNQNYEKIPAGVKYNLLIATPGSRAFKHVAASSNINGYATILDHVALNNKSNARLLVTQRWNGTYNASPVGVQYAAGRWVIFNQNRSTMKAGCEFNVVVDDAIFVTEASTGNTISNSHLIEPAIKSSSAAVFVSQYQTGSVFNDQEVGVRLQSGLSWAIYNQNTSKNIPFGAKFFVLVK